MGLVHKREGRGAPRGSLLDAGILRCSSSEQVRDAHGRIIPNPCRPFHYVSRYYEVRDMGQAQPRLRDCRSLLDVPSLSSLERTAGSCGRQDRRKDRVGADCAVLCAQAARSGDWDKGGAGACHAPFAPFSGCYGPYFHISCSEDRARDRHTGGIPQRRGIKTIGYDQ